MVALNRLSINLAILFFLLAFPITLAAFPCSVKSSCSPGEHEVLEIASGVIPSHVALPTENVYSHFLCCNNIVLEQVTPANYYGQRFISINAPYNAHVGKFGLYTYNLSLVAADNSGYYNCSIKSSCDAGEVCVAQVSGEESAHIADCSFGVPLPYKICCRFLTYLLLIPNYTEIDTYADKIVEVLIEVKNQALKPQNVSIDITSVVHQNATMGKEDVTVLFKKKYVVTFCRWKDGKCVENLPKEIEIAPMSTEKIFLRIVTPEYLPPLDRYIINVTFTTKSIKVYSYNSTIVLRRKSGIYNLKLSLYVTDSVGNPVKNKEVKIFICAPDVEYCDEPYAFFSYTARTDENGKVNVNIAPTLVTNTRYKLSVVAEKGYAETIIET